LVEVPSGWPIPAAKATVTSVFGSPRGRSRHQGIDLAAPSGTVVHATAGGEVTFAGRSGDFGRLVVVDHGGGWETRYAHLKTVKVDPGNVVARGAKIGTVGRSGNATGDHLHYEVRHDGTPLDPWPTLGR
jgi:murein DD-endopeptidase MepM/ murein hydrolase activator NlpD